VTDRGETANAGLICAIIAVTAVGVFWISLWLL
jgi:hypothetical protein